MLFSRRIDPVLQHSAPGPDGRDHRRLGARARRLTAGLALSALLAACGAPEQTGTAEGTAFSGPILINVTAAAAPAPGGVMALATMPRTEDFWRGVLIAAPGAGGLLAYNADGGVVATEEGPRFSSLASAPGFTLRGQDLPLLAAAEAGGGALSIYAFSRDQGAFFLAPTAPIAPEMSVRGVCAASDEAATFEFYVLGQDGGAELWSLRDTGEARLEAERLASLPTEAAGRLCAVNPETDDLYLGAPGAGVSRLSETGEVLAESGVEATGMTFGIFGGRRRLVVTQSGGQVLMLDPETLEIAERTRITQGFSTPGVDTPGAVTYTAATHGGAYPEGYLAIGDTADDTPKFIDRSYIGKRLAEPENPFAPGPASAA